MKKFILISIILPMACILTVRAQQVTVYDRSDLQPVSQVNIASVSGKVLVVTDAAGQAGLDGFSAGDSIRFTHVAYQTVSFTKASLAAAGFKVYLTENVIRLDELVISANKTEQKKSDIPYTIDVIQSKEIQFNNPQTSAIMLEQTGNVFVQQSQLGGGSPVLRGFEANRVLLVTDGVRMNNAIYRAGHLQSSITVDPFMISSTEVIYGPGSTIYGSDALGGVISFRTKDPELSNTGKAHVNGQGLLRFSSADLEKTLGVNFNIGLEKIAFLTNFSWSGFDDLREGQESNPFYGDWGKCLYYAERINGADSMISNPKPWIQKRSGYSQYNIMEKIIYLPVRDVKLTANFQYSNSSDIPRYDRLSEMDNSTGKLKYADWYYGPQQRIFASASATLTRKTALYDQANFILAYQNDSEDRINRRFGKSTKKFNLETASVWSLNADLTRQIVPKDRIQYGLESIFNNVGSRAYNQNIETGNTTYDLATRYPDSLGRTFSIAAYASNNWQINKSFAFSQGIRFNYIWLNAAYSDTMMAITGFPFDNTISQSNPAVNGYLGLVCTPGYDWKVSLVTSSGFRAPNIDDISKLNDSNSQDQLLIVPNPDLQPEYAYNVELAAGKTFLGHVRLELSGYYTWLENAIVLAPYSYNGKDSVLWEGEMCQTQANTNAGSAYIYGVTGNLVAQVTRSFSILSNLTFTQGRLTSDDQPLDHIPPIYGMTSFMLEVKRFKGEFYVMYNGWKHIEDYSPSGEDNEVYATPYGSPSWYTLNLKLSAQATKWLNVELGCENLLDANYRKFASGISAPGRNFIVALRGTF